MSSSRGNRYQQVGVDRLIRLDWLERAASLAQSGTTPDDAKDYLTQLLDPEFPTSSKNVRGSLDKTITILLRVWFRPPKELQSFRNRGLKLLSEIDRSRQIAVHWGMIMAVYPFWSAVAQQLGRLLNLQGTAAASHIQRRIKEEYGQRETVSRRVRYLIRSFVDWKVLEETETQGVYKPATRIQIDQLELVQWLAEALLHSRPQSTISFDLLLTNPSLFPFQIQPTHSENLKNDYLEIVSHGFDRTILSLREKSYRLNHE